MREIVGMPLLHCFVAMALAAQAGAAPTVAPSLPAPVVARQSLFTIPFQVRRVDDPARQPVEVPVYGSSDRGAHWNL